MYQKASCMATKYVDNPGWVIDDYDVPITGESSEETPLFSGGSETRMSNISMNTFIKVNR